MKKGVALAFSLVILSIASIAFMPTVSAAKMGIWANSTSESQAIHLSGSRNVVNGDLHSNNDLKISGSHNRINGTLEYVSNFIINGKKNNTYLNAKRTAPEDFPVHYNIEDYKPGGAEAIRAGSEIKHLSLITNKPSKIKNKIVFNYKTQKILKILKLLLVRGIT